MSRLKFKPDPARKYIAFFKPYGVLTQFTQPDGSDKSTLAEFDFPPKVYPLGRLDWDSEGLLLLSDDPRLNHVLLDPTHEHKRTYLVQVEHIPNEDSLDLLRNGVIVQGRETLPAEARLLADEPKLPPRPVPIRFRKSIPTAWIELSLKEGKNRQVRKMTAAVNHPTLRLVRVRIGNLDVRKLALQPGEWLKLTTDQLMSCFAD